MKLHFWRRLAVIKMENDHPKSLHELIDSNTTGVTKLLAGIVVEAEDVLQLINFTTKNRSDWHFFRPPIEMQV